MSAEPFVSIAVVVGDDTELTSHAHGNADRVIGAVQIGVNRATVIQSTSPAALRRLAMALLTAADQAEAITEAAE